MTGFSFLVSSEFVADAILNAGTLKETSLSTLQSLIIEERESFVPMLDNQYSNNILKLHNSHNSRKKKLQKTCLEKFKNFMT